MLLTLLASCDPCSSIDDGGDPGNYQPLAAALASRLQEPGCHAGDLFVLFPPDANAARVLQFVATAMDWSSRAATSARLTASGLSLD